MGDVSQRRAARAALPACAVGLAGVMATNASAFYARVFPEALVHGAYAPGYLRHARTGRCLDTAHHAGPGQRPVVYACNTRLPQRLVWLRDRHPYALLPAAQLELCLSGVTAAWVACDNGFHQPAGVGWRLAGDGRLVAWDGEAADAADAGDRCLAADSAGVVTVAVCDAADPAQQWAWDPVAPPPLAGV